MIGGMVRSESECKESVASETGSVENDSGSFCWSDNTQALILGAYFYGYAAQPIPAFIAKQFTGYTAFYRLWLLCAAALQFSLPALASISPTVVVVSQVVRGFFAGIMACYNFAFVPRWVIASEKEIMISGFGVLASLGCGTSAFIAGLISTSLGWQYVFYFSGSLFLLGLLLNVLFVQESPQQAWYLTKEEKDNISKEKSVDITRTDQEEASMMSVICKVYLPAFCMYTISFNFVLYNLINVLPFYLNRVLKTSPLFLSYLNMGAFLAMSISTIFCVCLVRVVDLYLPWLHCRMLFIVVPMALQVVYALVLPLISTPIGGVLIIAVSAVSGCTLFSGGLFLASYEMDPKNSPFLVSIFNSVGQISGFIGPILMAAITETAADTDNFEVVYKQKWAYFFYVTSGVAFSGCLAIVLAYVIKPSEWVNRSIKNVNEDVRDDAGL